MKTRRATMTIATLLTTVALAVTGCGNDSNGSTTSSRTSRPGPSRVDPAQLKVIQKCLKAAGLSQSLPEGAPTGIPSNLPSGAPTDVPSNFPGRPGGQFDDPQVQAALKACGIQLPTRPGG